MSWKKILKGYEIEGPERLVNSIANAESIEELNAIVKDNEIKYVGSVRNPISEQPFAKNAIDATIRNLERNGYSTTRMVTRRHGLRQLFEKEGMEFDAPSNVIVDTTHENYPFSNDPRRKFK